MLNNQIFYFFYNLSHQNLFFDKLVVFIAVYFPYIVVLLAGLFLLIHHDSQKSPPDRIISVIRARWKEIVLVFFSGGCAWLVAKMLKLLIHSPRPFASIPNVVSLFSETGYAFPSNHAAFFAAIAVSIFLSHKKAGYWFMSFALLIGLARILAGVHFPIDILGGFILGSVIAYFFKKV